MKKDAIRIHRTKLTWRGTSCTDFIPDVVPHDPKVPPTAISCRPGTSWDSSIYTCRWQFNLWVILNFLLCLGPAEIQMIGFVHMFYMLYAIRYVVSELCFWGSIWPMNTCTCIMDPTKSTIGLTQLGIETGPPDSEADALK